MRVGPRSARLQNLIFPSRFALDLKIKQLQKLSIEVQPSTVGFSKFERSKKCFADCLTISPMGYSTIRVARPTHNHKGVKHVYP